jgi:hypothetical protein
LTSNGTAKLEVKPEDAKTNPAKPVEVKPAVKTEPVKKAEPTVVQNKTDVKT